MLTSLTQSTVSLTSSFRCGWTRRDSRLKRPTDTERRSNISITHHAFLRLSGGPALEERSDTQSCSSCVSGCSVFWFDPVLSVSECVLCRCSAALRDVFNLGRVSLLCGRRWRDLMCGAQMRCAAAIENYHSECVTDVCR